MNIENMLIDLKNVLAILSFIVLGICFEKLFFTRKEVKKSENVIILVLMTSLSLAVMTFDELITRVFFGYLIFFGIIYVLSREMIQKE